MIDFQPIRISDKELLSSYLHTIPPTLIEHSFNTLFAWQNPHCYEWAICADDVLLIKTTYQHSTGFMPPILKGGFDPLKYKQALQIILDCCDELGIKCRLVEVSDADLAKIEQVMPGFFSAKQDRNNANYVYRVEALTTLSGKRYHNKRNHLNSFKRNYPYYEFLPITEELIEPCKKTLLRWCAQNNCKNFPTLQQETCAIQVLFEHWDELDVYGACIRIGDRIEAFAIGEILSEDTVAILIEKANDSFSGIYSAINQMFLAEYWQDFEYVNRAEDLGLANLRRTKLDYHPDHLAMKHILVPYSQLTLKSQLHANECKQPTAECKPSTTECKQPTDQ